MHVSKEQMKMLDRLKKRSDFLCAQNKGKKWVSKGLVLQAVQNDLEKTRFGLTVSKRVSKSAVVRNQLRRRLRAVAYEVLPIRATGGMDYVLIGRVSTKERSFSALQKDLEWCIDRLDLSKVMEEEK